tara:strand:+ start:1160 stop:1783 length:624 start_codon:yes stop_codon:yes gene_type:complete
MNIFQNTDAKFNTIINNNSRNTTNKKNSRELNKFQAMHRLVESKLSNYLNDFRRGNYETLNNEFTNEEYQRFGLLLTNRNTFNNRIIENFEYRPETFNSYRISFHRILDGLKLSIINNNLLTTTTNDLSNANAILNNQEKLKEFIIKNYGPISGLNEFSVSTNLKTSLVLKEEYRIYIERHGFPQNFIFESDKISAIRLELERRNVP